MCIGRCMYISFVAFIRRHGKNHWCKFAVAFKYTSQTNHECKDWESLPCMPE